MRKERLLDMLEGLPEVHLPLVADRDVPAGGFISRVTTAARVLVTQFLEGSEGQS